VAKGVSEITGADDEQAPLAVEAEDLDNILTEFTHVVANSPYAELAEVREVLSDLGRVEVEPLCQLLAGDGFDTEVEELIDASQVDRET
jgi:hypothetical protein